MHSKSTCTDSLSNHDLLRFLIVTCVLGALTQILAIRAGLRNGGYSWLMLTMWVPTVAALTSRTGRSLALVAIRSIGGRWLALGFLVGCAPQVIKTVVLMLMGVAHWDSDHFLLEADRQSVKGVHHLGMILGVGHQSFSWFAVNLVISIALGSVVTALIGGVGEEIGWRAVLQPSLENRFGRFNFGRSDDELSAFGVVGGDHFGQEAGPCCGLLGRRPVFCGKRGPSFRPFGHDRAANA